MTQTIKIGSFRVEDKNENDFFDPQVDQIKNQKGEPLRPDSEEVKKALDEIGIGSLENVGLWNASILSSVWRRAGWLAGLGHPEDVDLSLKRAREYSKTIDLPFDEKRAEDLMASSYWTAAENRIGEKESSRGYSGQGLPLSLDSIQQVKALLTSAEIYAVKGGAGFDVKRAEEVLNLSYLQYIEGALAAVEKHILEGRDGEILPELDKIIRYAEEAPLHLDPKRIKLFIDYDSGNQKVKGLIRSYLNALRLAEKVYALNGDVESTEYWIHRAEALAFKAQKEFGIDSGFSDFKASEVLMVAHRNRIEINFKKAEGSDTLEKIQDFLKEAYEECQEIGVAFDQERANDILQRFHARVLSSYYQSAQNAAEVAWELGCMDLLRAGHKYAEKNGSFFDLKCADRIIRKLLLTRYTQAANISVVVRVIEEIHAFETEVAQTRQKSDPPFDKRYDALLFKLSWLPPESAASLKLRRYDLVTERAIRLNRIVPSYEDWLSSVTDN